MTQLSRERLENYASGNWYPDADDVRRMARRLLAAEAQEPVAYMYRDNLHADARFSQEPRFGNWSPEDINEYEITETKLYAAPQPVAVPDEITREEYKRRFMEEADFDNTFRGGWNACRAAMLQPSSGALQLPDGWKLVPVEPTKRMIIDGFESEPDELFSEPEEWEAYQKMSGCQQAAHRAKLCWAAMLASAPQEPTK